MIPVLVEVTRGGAVESVHEVQAFAVGAGADALPHDGADPQVYWRSSAKFLQALPVVESGAADRFGLSAEELALCCASHSGAPEHVAAAAAILAKAGNTPDQLYCGPHAPFDEAEARRLRQRGEAPTRLHNNCSGKHAGMLAVCRARGWATQGYQALPHPLQQEILQVMSNVTGVPAAQIGTAVDGCGAVVFRTPLSAMARAFRDLAAGELPAPHREAGQRLVQAVRAAPLMLAGRGRFCTALLEATSGRVVAKVGAEGVYGLGTAGLSGGGPGGLALKVRDGATRAAVPALCLLCRALGWLRDEELERLRPFWQVPIHNHEGEEVGEIRARLPT